jgi:hypothetical protein
VGFPVETATFFSDPQFFKNFSDVTAGQVLQAAAAAQEDLIFAIHFQWKIELSLSPGAEIRIQALSETHRGRACSSFSCAQGSSLG